MASVFVTLLLFVCAALWMDGQRWRTKCRIERLWREFHEHWEGEWKSVAFETLARAEQRERRETRVERVN